MRRVPEPSPFTSAGQVSVPSTHDLQVISGRLDREGQRCYPEPITAIYLVAEDGSDPPTMEVLGVKASQAQAIMDPALDVQASASDASKLEGLVGRYLEGQARGMVAS